MGPFAKMSKLSRQDAKLLRQIAQSKDFRLAFEAIDKLGHFKYVTFVLQKFLDDNQEIPFFKSTYPHEWLAHYLQQGYRYVDPVVFHGLASKKPFFWDELELSTDKQVQLFEDAARFEIGKSGYSVPMSIEPNEFSMFTVTSDLEGDAWRQLIEQEAELLAEIAIALRNLAIDQLFGKKSNKLLEVSELECLYYAAIGTSIEETAKILEKPLDTVNRATEKARQKLGCKTTQEAIAVAIRQRLISI